MMRYLTLLLIATGCPLVLGCSDGPPANPFQVVEVNARASHIACAADAQGRVYFSGARTNAGYVVATDTAEREAIPWGTDEWTSIDIEGEYAYLGASVYGTNGLERVSLTTGDRTVVVPNLVTAAEHVLDVQARGDDVYWTSQDGVWHWDSSMSNLPTRMADTGLDRTGSLALGATSLYWTELRELRFAEFTGVETGVLASADGYSPNWAFREVAVDTEHVYFLLGDETGGVLGRVPQGGGPIEELATGHPAPAGLRVHEGSVYWASGETNRAVTYPGFVTVFRLPLAAGGEPIVLARHQNGVRETFVVDDTLYWCGFVAFEIASVALE